MALEQPPYVLTIPSDLRFLECARAFVTAVCQAAGLDSTCTQNLALAAHEAMNNAIRHGQARKIRITLGARDGVVTLTIRDDGRGLPDPLDETKGLGIRIMKNRAGVIGGVVSIGPAEGGGTLVTCTLPGGRRHG